MKIKCIMCTSYRMIENIFCPNPKANNIKIISLNFIELRKELKTEYVFKTNSDTEVLLASYIVWGKKCLSKLNGMFSFAIYDTHDKILFAFVCPV